MSPPTQYAVAADGARIAYQIFGDGPTDLVFVPGWVSHVELSWAEPHHARFLRRLGEAARVVVFDKRGTGMSDRGHGLPDLDTRMDDVRAVMDAAGLGRAALFGVSEGAAMCCVFGATYPERTTALMMHGAQARSRRAADYPWGRPQEWFDEELSQIEQGWEDGGYARLAVPRLAASRADDAAFTAAWAEYFRRSCSTQAALELDQMWWDLDYRGILPSLRIPTLVTCCPNEQDEAAYLTERIPGAKLVVVPGSDHVAWTGEAEPILEAMTTFLGEVEDEAADLSRVLATILFTDIVGSTETLTRLGDRGWKEVVERHHALVRGLLERYRGREVNTAGDGFFATFDGPARAIRCAQAIVKAVRPLGLEVRAGLHTGECELIDDEVGGIAVNIGARVGAAAGPSEVLVSQTVFDLVAGSGLTFTEAGEHDLKGVPGPWRLYRVA